MQLNELLVNTKPPEMDKDSWTTRGLSQYGCCFIGYLTNTQTIQEQLGLSVDDNSGDNISSQNNQDFEKLILVAIERWGQSINQYLQGDYVIAWLNDQHLGITASARSSFSLFYTLQNQANAHISIASEIKLLHQSSNELNPVHCLQQLVLGPFIGRHTYLDNIRRLQPGETILWDINAYKCCHQIRLEGEQQLKFANISLARTSLASNAQTISLDDQHDSSQLFNRLPQVAHRLGEPINDGLLAQFDQQISQNEASVIKLDETWFSGRTNINEPPFNKQTFNSKISWQKGIVHNSLLKYRYHINQRQDYLYSAFEIDNHDELTFAQWLDLHFVIPAWCQLYQSIANGYGKIIINPFMRAEQTLALVNNNLTSQSTGYFAIEDSSLFNVYDAMQRLFRNSEASTKQWFKLEPIVTARFIKQNTQFPRLVEQTCINMLTFDYLAKFHHNQIGSD